MAARSIGTRPSRDSSERAEHIRLAKLKEQCWTDPKPLLAEMKGWDPTQQESFSFNMYDPTSPWYWQSDVINWWVGGGKDDDTRSFLILKARQLGITWLAVAFGLWHILYKPGATVAAYSHGQEDSVKLCRRAWLMYSSLPERLRSHVEVLRPKSELPNEWIILRHQDGEISSFQALPATPRAGHGDTITLGIMDEVARMESARQIYSAINPAVSRGGRLIMISTANGVSNPETGEGNFFHHLYSTAKEKNISFRFLPWHMHPERDEAWYQLEAMKLDEVERNQMYPLNAQDAFMLSGHVYCDPTDLAYYRGEVRVPLFCGVFDHEGGKGKFVRIPNGPIEVYQVPRPGAKYGISADPASGQQGDYSVADVGDLDTHEIVASMRTNKMDIPAFAVQLKFLGRWYKDVYSDRPAMIIPERSGGWGEALIICLTDETSGLKPYGHIFRYTDRVKMRRSISETYGFPVNMGTRGKLLEGMKASLRERRFPWLTAGHVDELSSFVLKETKPSPRAEDGCHDDRVFSLALLNHLMEKYGTQPQKIIRAKRWRSQKYVPHPSRAGD